MSTRLIVFAKAPIQGWCNTRLIPDIGQAQAAALQAASIIDTLRTCEQTELPTQLILGIPQDVQTFDSRFYRFQNLTTETTNESNLGSLIQQKTKTAIAGNSLLLGTDTPHALSQHLNSAIHLLENSITVLGPTKDGGVYLIGFQNPNGNLLQNVPWGTESVFSTLKSNGEKMGSVQVTPHSFDIDLLEDVKNLKALLQRSPGYAPTTAALLKEWDLK